MLRSHTICWVIVVVTAGQPLVAAQRQRMTLEPSQITLTGSRSQVQLVVSDPDHPTTDLTRRVTYSTADSSVATVTDTGVVGAIGNGTTTVSVKFGDTVLNSPITVADMNLVKPVSFFHETLPILARTGCSGGSCHGAPHGKAGFQLSLFGGDPLFDRDALVRAARSRRVSPLRPENSLLLRKPAMQVPHMGGQRFSVGSSAYNLLAQWISEGCNVNEPSVDCIGIDVFPEGAKIIRLPTGSQQLRVTAQFADGSARDVTHLAKYESSDASTASVTSGGFVDGKARGDVAIIVRYLEFIQTPLLTFVNDRNDFEWAPPAASNFVDEFVDRKLYQMQFVPAELCSDETFLRRVFLDVIGVLPTPQERKHFLESTSSSRRQDLVEELMIRPEYSRFWAQKWGDLLRVSRKQIGVASVFKYSEWLRSAIAENRPYDEVARALITATGSSVTNPAANYYRTSADTNDAMETTAQLFLGTRIQCAKCHNHPFERWTQNNYYGLAAVFHRVGRKKTNNSDETIVFPSPGGEVIHPVTGQVQQPWVPGNGLLVVAENKDRRAAFADWLTGPENQLFAAVEVNRIWAHLMGRGIVDPPDDFRDSNPPSNPDLLDRLATEFRESGYDRNHILRTILNSRTYQAKSTATELNQADRRYFSRYYPRRLSAEQVVDALVEVTGVPENFVAMPSGTRATWLPAPDLKPHNRAELGNIDFLKVFGQPERQSVCECERGDDSSLGQALQLLNGEFLHRRLTAPESRFRLLLRQKVPVADIVRDIYVRALCRQPVADELAAALDYLSNAESVEAAFEDICWAIVSKEEFLFQH